MNEIRRIIRLNLNWVEIYELVRKVYVGYKYMNSTTLDSSRKYPVQVPFKQHLAQGFTLIELMVSLLLGALIISGIFQVLISSNTINRNTFAGNTVQEAGRFAMDFLTTDIAMAGSRRIYDSASNAPEGFRITLGKAIDNPIVTQSLGNVTVTYLDGKSHSMPIETAGFPENNPMNVHGDALVVRFYPPKARGCDGNSYNVGDLITNVYWARGDREPAGGNTADAAVDGDTGGFTMDALYCFSFSGDVPPNSVDVFPLVIGVEAMEIMLLEAGTSTYSAPSSNIEGKNVEEVRIALLLRSKQTLNRDAGAPNERRKYNLLGTEYEAPSDQSARLFRQVYTSSARVVNRPES